MKRSEFFKSIFAAGALTILPGAKTKSECNAKIYKFDDIFHVHDGNPNLVYPKVDSEIYVMLKKAVGERLVDEKHFSAYFHMGDVILPVKEEYTINDFVPMVLALHNVYRNDILFSEYEQGSFFRFIKKNKGGASIFTDSELYTIPDSMHLILFSADNNYIADIREKFKIMKEGFENHTHEYIR